MPPNVDEVRDWIQKADNDRDTAELGLQRKSRPITDTASFHCQQAIEKLFKAFLTWNECEFEKIHDLDLLCRQCAGVDSSFESLIEHVRPLTSYAVRYRYPGSACPTVDDVRKALAVVAHVRKFVLDRLPPEVRVSDLSDPRDLF